MGKRTRSKPQGGLIASVEPGSIAARLELRVGDRLLAINGKTLRDLIDYRYEVAEEYLHLRVKRDDTIFTLETEKEIDQDLGLSFELAVFDSIIECHNRCSFCFIHQMAKGLRKTLYIMDDDFRLSFLQGNFVTLTNMTPADWKRVYQDRLSPLNVSVHTTNPVLREQMIKHPRAGEILKHLKRLAKRDIDFNVQIVYCPGFNDGAELDRTLAELERFLPHLRAIAIVPVGLTQFRTYLDKLEPVSRENARQAIAQIKRWQKRYTELCGDPIVRLGDEFYDIADLPTPGARHYGEFEQLGDGVGGGSLIGHDFKRLAKHLPERLEAPRRVTVVTGRAAERYMSPLIERLNAVEGLQAELAVLRADFWGPMISVTGLLTAQDVTRQLGERGALGDAVLLSDVMFKPGTELTLDGKTRADIEEALGVPTLMVENSARGLIGGALGVILEPLTDRAYGNPYEPAIPDFH